MGTLKLNNKIHSLNLLILISLALFSPIFEHFFSIKILTETIATIIFLFILLNIKNNFKIYTYCEIVSVVLLSIYLFIYLLMNITENTLYKTLTLLFSISFFFLSKYIKNIKNELIFYLKKINSIIILFLLSTNFYYFVMGDIYSLDQFFSIIISIISMSVLIFEFIKKKINYESYLHFIFILYTSQFKVFILLIITFSFLILIFSNSKTNLKYYLKIISISVIYFLISYSINLITKDLPIFTNIKNFSLKSEQLILGNHKDLSHKPIIGLNNIKKYNFKENLDELSTKQEGPAYTSLNKRFTEWQIAKNKINEFDSFIKLEGLEDNLNYYHNIFFGINVNYGYLGLTIFILIVSFIIFKNKKDIFKFFLNKEMSDKLIFLIISMNLLIIYSLSIPYYHSKFLALFFGLAYFDKSKN